MWGSALRRENAGVSREASEVRKQWALRTAGAAWPVPAENPAVWGVSKSGRTNGCWSLAKVLGWNYYPLLMSKELTLSGFRSTQEQVVVREFQKAMRDSREVPACIQTP